jgi:hypothetical protein
MERIAGINDLGGLARDEVTRAERLRHRRAAAERCERTGLLRRCATVPPRAVTRCCEA